VARALIKRTTECNNNESAKSRERKQPSKKPGRFRTATQVVVSCGFVTVVPVFWFAWTLCCDKTLGIFMINLTLN
jgi:hypothetical protein